MVRDLDPDLTHRAPDENDGRRRAAKGQTGAYAVRDIRVGNTAVYPGASFRPSFTLDAVTGTVALFHAAEGAGTTLQNAVAGSPNAIVNPGTSTWASYGATCQ